MRIRPGRLVIALAQAHDLETVLPVHLDRGFVVGAHFQERRRALLVGPGQQVPQQRLAHAAPLVHRVHADGVYLGLGVRRTTDDGEPGVADQPLIGVGADVVVALVELGGEGGPRPRVITGEEHPLQFRAALQIAATQFQHAQRGGRVIGHFPPLVNTDFRLPGASASGRRR